MDVFKYVDSCVLCVREQVTGAELNKVVLWRFVFISEVLFKAADQV